MIDNAIIRAHACAAGASQGHLDIAQDQALGRSKGGFSTKTHVMVDGRKPLGFYLNRRTGSRDTQAYVLIDGVKVFIRRREPVPLFEAQADNKLIEITMVRLMTVLRTVWFPPYNQM
ncbi:MAG: hypothetical protein GXP08_08250 [Gammaproteobacteria bacterium]|nr:hypothetical protein [Gammaproteobacteria bacterium]